MIECAVVLLFANSESPRVDYYADTTTTLFTGRDGFTGEKDSQSSSLMNALQEFQTASFTWPTPPTVTQVNLFTRF